MDCEILIERLSKKTMHVGFFGGGGGGGRPKKKGKKNYNIN
jgi:hypothetical protein